jgi:hypothetical protein
MGRGLHLTVDEWFFYHFDNEELLPATFKLFADIYEVCDKIVLKRGTPLMNKFNILVESSSMYPSIQRQAVKAVVKLFLQNSNKIQWVENDFDLEEIIETQLPRHDVYLVKMCLLTEDKIFVTTDSKLYSSLITLQEELQIKVFMANDFMLNYPTIQ